MAEYKNAQERIQQARFEQEKAYREYNMIKKQEEIEGNFKYEKSVFLHRNTKCSYTTAVNYIKTYYKEIKIGKAKLMKMMKESELIKYVGTGSIGFRNSLDSTFSGYSKTSYEMIDMNSVDDFAVSLLNIISK